jgi:hypothetical protein
MDAAAVNWTPWLALAGLGAFHGLNPAMGWLFAVALGLHRSSGRVVLVSLAPIAVGHAISVGTVLAVVLAAGLVLDPQPFARAAGLVLIGWAGWHVVYGHRRRVRIGMQTGLVGLGLWSFLMASAHGAGLMLVPVVVPLCLAPGPMNELAGTGSGLTALAALGVHTAAMLAVIAAISFVVYRFTGVAFLRRGWFNLDLVWSAALAGMGIYLLAS